MEARDVTISTFEIMEVKLPVVQFRVVCSTGTYIRSLANDYGVALGVGGHLSSLCRTRIGEFLLKDAQSVQQFEEEVKGNQNG
jgi:tRNA pseudouridine55 synthase